MRLKMTIALAAAVAFGAAIWTTGAIAHGGGGGHGGGVDAELDDRLAEKLGSELVSASHESGSRRPRGEVGRRRGPGCR